jgi:hypothetical protein
MDRLGGGEGVESVQICTGYQKQPAISRARLTAPSRDQRISLVTKTHRMFVFPCLKESTVILPVVFCETCSFILEK